MNNEGLTASARQILYCFFASAWYRPLTTDVVTLTHNKLLDIEAPDARVALLAEIDVLLQQQPQQGDVFFQLFEGLAEPLIPLYSSWYISGSFFELPLLRVRKTLIELGYTRSENNPLSEDHISSLFETMALLIEDETVDVQANFYNQHIGSWLDMFIKHYQVQLNKVANNQVYATVLRYLQQFKNNEDDLLQTLAQPPVQQQLATNMEN